MLSGLLFARAFYRVRLFDLLSVARDTVVESLGDAVIVVDVARRVLDMNAAAHALAGWPAVWTGRLVDMMLPLLHTVRLDVWDDSSTRMAHEVDARGPRN